MRRKTKRSSSSCGGGVGSVQLRMKWVPVFQDLTKIETLSCDLHLGGVGLSLIDGIPRELMYLYLRDIHLNYHTIPIVGTDSATRRGEEQQEKKIQQNIE